MLRDAEYNAVDSKHNQHVRPFFYHTQTLARDSLYCTVLKRTSSTELDLGVPTDYRLGLLLCFKKKEKENQFTSMLVSGLNSIRHIQLACVDHISSAFQGLSSPSNYIHTEMEMYTVIMQNTATENSQCHDKYNA